MLSYLHQKIFARKKRRYLAQDILINKLPLHIAIIMDGNGRWAKKRGLPRFAGHRAGIESLRRVVKECIALGIRNLTVYAFSTENWKRPPEEVSLLMGLLVEFIDREIDELDSKGVNIRFIGSKNNLNTQVCRQIEIATLKTANNNSLYLQIALNYGGRFEIIEAVKRIAEETKGNVITPQDIDEELFSKYLYTSGLPDPDIIIRSSGELRLSNFLLWQSAYSELWFSNVLWPDFSEEDLRHAIYDYQTRNRRYGAV